MSQHAWQLDPDDPRAPTEEVWAQLSPEERARVVASLPAGMPLDLHPPEGDEHRKPKEGARDALDAFFRRIGRKVYLSSELVTYYPGEQRFCPDVLAVLDVEQRDRSSWIVANEGKGLDLVIEVHVGGGFKKDAEVNVVRYARLGISEYFVFDRPRSRILGHRLRPGGGTYERIVPQAGRLASGVLGLDLSVEGGMLRFFYGTAPLPFMDEIVARLDGIIVELIESRDAAERRAQEEAQRARQEAQRAEDLQRQVEDLRRQVEKLTRK